jgi:hypothetical protein
MEDHQSSRAIERAAIASPGGWGMTPRSAPAERPPRAPRLTGHALAREASGIEVDNRETYAVRVLGDRIVRVEEYRAREPVLAVVR